MRPSVKDHSRRDFSSTRGSPTLVTFYDDEASDGNGTTVAFSAPTPAGDVFSVSATITGTIPEKLFVDVQVTQP